MDLSKFDGFLEFMHEIETQDNRATATPILIECQTPHKIYTKDGYGDGEAKASEELGEDCEEEYGVDPDETLYWQTVWRGEQWFFTYSGYEKHMMLNKHNYPPATRNYVQCLAYRNPEMVQVFEWLRALKEEILAEKNKP